MQLQPRPDEAVFEKLTMSAFDSSALGFAMRDCGVKAAALTGMAVEIGIEPTARQAASGLVTRSLRELGIRRRPKP